MTKSIAFFVAAFAAALVFGVSTAAASCMPLSAAQKRAAAHVIFDGVALDGPTATGIQRFRVLRWSKGSGPRIVRVQTGHVVRPDGTGMTTSVSLVVKRNEKWRIFARGSARKVLRSNACDGSRRLSS